MLPARLAAQGLRRRGLETHALEAGVAHLPEVERGHRVDADGRRGRGCRPGRRAARPGPPAPGRAGTPRSSCAPDGPSSRRRKGRAGSRDWPGRRRGARCRAERPRKRAAGQELRPGHLPAAGDQAVLAEGLLVEEDAGVEAARLVGQRRPRRRRPCPAPRPPPGRAGGGRHRARSARPTRSPARPRSRAGSGPRPSTRCAWRGRRSRRGCRGRGRARPSPPARGRTRRRRGPKGLRPPPRGRSARRWRRPGRAGRPARRAGRGPPPRSRRGCPASR